MFYTAKEYEILGDFLLFQYASIDHGTNQLKLMGFNRAPDSVFLGLARNRYVIQESIFQALIVSDQPKIVAVQKN